MVDLVLVRINTPDRVTAESIAAETVARRLAACANIEPPIKSVYRWQGKIEHAEEFPVILKTRREHFEAISELVRTLHPDDTPAILAIPILQTTPRFGAWIFAETQ